MKLYMVPAAPNPTKVMLYIAEKTAAGAEMGIEQVLVNALKNEQRSAETSGAQPVRESGPYWRLRTRTYIVESLAIIEYLEDCFPQPTLWGKGVRERIRARELERIADLRGTASNRAVYPCHAIAYRPAPPIRRWRSQARHALPVAFQYFEQVLADGAAHCFWESAYRWADCTLQAALQFMRFCQV